MDYYQLGRKDGLYDKLCKKQSELNCSDSDYEQYLEGYQTGNLILQSEMMEYEYDEFI